MSNRMYQGVRWEKMLSILNKKEEDNNSISKTASNDITTKQLKCLESRNLEVSKSSIILNADNIEEQFDTCDSTIIPNQLVAQIEFDNDEKMLLERQNSCRFNLNNTKSLSLTDLTVDNLLFISEKRCSSVPTVLMYEFPTKMSNCDSKVNYENYSLVDNSSTTECESINETGDINQTLGTKQKIKSLSLSNLTEDNQTYRYTSTIRSQSVPPENQIGHNIHCESPSILRCVADFTNDKEYCQPANFPVDSSGSEFGSSDGYYGDLDEGRKRRHVARVDEWKKNKAYKKRMRGEEYLGYSKPRGAKMQQDTIRPPKLLGETCTSDFCRKSKFRGCSRFSEETRKALHTYFWKKLHWKDRKVYVRQLVYRTPVTQLTKGQNNSRREGTFKYFLSQNNDAEKIQVCKQMFLNTLSLKSTAVQSWVKNEQLDDVDVAPSAASANEANDEHPQANNEPQRDPRLDKVSILNDFLTSIPKLPSHYARKDTRKLYLEPVYRTVTDVYKEYKKYCTEQNLPSVSRFTFDKTFKNKNLSLHTLKKDMCDICVSHKEGNTDEHEFQEHLLRKNRAREEKATDKKKASKGEFILLTMDLEAVKVCPFLTASALYFKTKLTCHNFTVYDLTTRHCTCYWFTETAADLSASTFTSLLIDYLTRCCLPKRKPIVIYSDGCTYQNRNAILANALLHFSIKNKVTITQKYLERGHTQMECDSVHSAIERKLTNREINLPCDYLTVTKEARTPPYEVIQIDHNFVKNYADSSSWLYKSIRPGRVAGEPTVTDIRAILYDQTVTLQVKLHFDQEWMGLPHRPRRTVSSDVLYSNLRTEMIPISATKYQHLQELKRVLPPETHNFYDNLPHL